MGLKRFLERLGHSHRLDNEATQFLEDRRLTVSAVMPLITDALYRDEAALTQAGEFALHSSSSRANTSDNLRGVKALIRMAEQQRQHALLHFREQGDLPSFFGPRLT